MILTQEQMVAQMVALEATGNQVPQVLTKDLPQELIALIPLVGGAVQGAVEPSISENTNQSIDQESTAINGANQTKTTSGLDANTLESGANYTGVRDNNIEVGGSDWSGGRTIPASEDALVDIADFADVEFKDLSKALQDRWIDAVANKNATIQEANDIQQMSVKNGKNARLSAITKGFFPSGQKPTNVPVESSIISAINDASLTPSQKDFIKKEGVPVSLISPPSQIPVSIDGNISNENVEGLAGSVIRNHILNANRKKGSFIVVNDNVGYTVSNAGNIIDQYPFDRSVKLQYQTVRSNDNTVQGGVAKISLPVSKLKETSSKGVFRKNGLQLSGIQNRSLYSKGRFTGDVYFVQPNEKLLTPSTDLAIDDIPLDPFNEKQGVVDDFDLIKTIPFNDSGDVITAGAFVPNIIKWAKRPIL